MKPNEYVTFFSFMLASVRSKDLWKITRLRAVSDFPVLEEYYYKLHTENASANRPREPFNWIQRSEMKKTLCEKIFTAPYFLMRQQDWIDAEEGSVRHTLRMYYDPIFKSIFKNRLGRYTYKNPYRLYSFQYDHERLGDYMFVCLVRKRKSRKIKPYFVTRVYDVNLFDGGCPIAGRFIFTYDRSDLVVQALAEQSARESTFDNRAGIAEYYYVKYRREGGTLGPAEMDPICWLTPSNKLRLCTSIFASKVLRRTHHFSPSVEHVEFECRKRRIALVTPRRVRILFRIKHSSNFDWDGSRTYKEWTIGCTARSDYRRNGTTYYVSRGGPRNTAFVYTGRPSDDKLVVAHYFKNVSVAGGETNKEDEVACDEAASFRSSETSPYGSAEEEEGRIISREFEVGQSSRSLLRST